MKAKVLLLVAITVLLLGTLLASAAAAEPDGWRWGAPDIRWHAPTVVAAVNSGR